MEEKKLGIYIHVPFCESKCSYCAFYSKPLARSHQSSKAERFYVQNVIGKIISKGMKYRKKYIVDSIFIGGGTPSVLTAEEIAAILGAVNENFTVSSGAEVTIEVNPSSLTGEKLKKYKSFGVNRLSIGAQSCDDEILRVLGRAHRHEDFLEKFRLARKVGFSNINVDLMFAVPGQDMDQWINTLREIIELSPEHISFYSLQIEEGTPFYDMYLDGSLDFVTEETDRAMYHKALEILREAGYEHYEISNVAKPGHQCRHNLKYWSFQEYLGIGETASSFVEGVRFTEKPREEYHVNDFEDNIGEFMFTGLRKVSGISKTEFKALFGKELWEVYEKRRHFLDEFFEKGQLVEEGDILRITEYGFDVSNNIMSVFV
ncbi:MAG: radical SAM family heme chaperone HemW [Hornefia sp.]|nr:radical SAM family heme chaperone HemW [Hornefia sp.]